MGDPGLLRCQACDMVFRSRPLLDVHTQRLCIGRLTGEELRPPCPGLAPGLDAQPGPGVIEVGQLEANRTEPEAEPWGRRGLEVPAPRTLTEEVHRLQLLVQEMGLGGPEPLVQGRGGPRGRENREQLRALEEAHARRLAEIQAQNRSLEQQRDGKFRMGGCCSSPSSPLLSNVLVHSFEYIYITLFCINRHLADLAVKTPASQEPQAPGDHGQPPQGCGGEGSHQEGSQLDPPAEKERCQVGWRLFSASPGPLAAEIRALHLGYVQGGGRDRRVLTQMAELHTEATALESERKRSERKTRRAAGAAARGLDEELWAVEAENQRLEGEILKLKLHRGQRRTRRGRKFPHFTVSLVSAERPPPLPPSLGPGDPYLACGAKEWPRPQTPVPTHHILAPPDVLGPAPYDPAAGLVVFYDFLLGLERPWLQVRLVSGLARAGQELGTPTPLPTSPCLALPPARGRPRGSCAILASKQPVPRPPNSPCRETLLHPWFCLPPGLPVPDPSLPPPSCPTRLRPCPTLSLLMVLEASGGFSPSGGELEGLKPRGWAKLRLFDPERRALSGRWRVPLRALPADPSLTPEQLNGVPQAGRAELYLRVANARDAEVQSLAEVDPSRAPDYLFPPPVPHPVGRDSGSLRPLPTSLGPLPADFVDPPPAREPSPQHTPSLG
ncbi:coiled-coil domain-containing protein 17 [Ornithorhynchus anatinus]|uniref:coiled-coil domain-containing protein 17 n=1 Tax=Ornithorhynchus anatinus TaxID=9258 RepID=UPI0010A8D31D|nr:coiled-coil domain-containing protein 17 [Ornithorhynchus anatinus]